MKLIALKALLDVDRTLTNVQGGPRILIVLRTDKQ